MEPHGLGMLGTRAGMLLENAWPLVVLGWCAAWTSCMSARVGDHQRVPTLTLLIWALFVVSSARSCLLCHSAPVCLDPCAALVGMRSPQGLGVSRCPPAPGPHPHWPGMASALHAVTWRWSCCQVEGVRWSGGDLLGRAGWSRNRGQKRGAGQFLPWAPQWVRRSSMFGMGCWSPTPESGLSPGLGSVCLTGAANGSPKAVGWSRQQDSVRCHSAVPQPCLGVP